MLTSSPLGNYTYGPGMQAGTNPSPLHAALAIGSSYTASYDQAGNMTCRAPSSSTTCAGSTPTGAQLTYDNEGRLIGWQSTPFSPPDTASFLYDGEGNRVEQQTWTSGQFGGTTTYIYLGALEKLAITSSSSTTTTDYYAGGVFVALATNGSFSYLGTDGLGSVDVVGNASGSVQATRLYGPYGTQRYFTGSIPAAKGFTGQWADGPTGLDYYTARYYDPLAGQFISADTMGAGLNAYAYVGDNPESRIDPTGHDWFDTAMDWTGNAWQAASNFLGIPQIQQDSRTFHDPHASLADKAGAFLDTAWIGANDALLLTGIGEGLDAVAAGGRMLLAEGGADAAARVAGDVVGDVTTRVAGDLTGDAGGRVAGTAGDVGDVGAGGGGGGDTPLYRGKQIGQTAGPPSSGDLGIPGRPNVNGVVDIKPKGGMVGPSYTGKQGLSTFNGMNPAVRNVQAWWQTSVGSLPQGLRAIPGVIVNRKVCHVIL